MMDRLDELTLEEAERLERYREWKRSHARKRATRRWRWTRGVSMVFLLSLTMGALVTWLTALCDPRERVASEPLAASPATEVAPEKPADGPVVPWPPPVIAPMPAAERMPVTPRRAPRAPSAAPKLAPSDHRASSSDPEAAVRPSPTLPASLDAPLTAARTPPGRRTRRLARARHRRRSSARRVEPFPVGAESTLRECEGVRQRMGEVQEFRDGVHREAGEFRPGFAKVRQGLHWCGAKLRGAE
jgi:hypothetical protein